MVFSQSEGLIRLRCGSRTGLWGGVVQFASADLAAFGQFGGGQGGEGKQAQQGHHEAGVFVGRERQVLFAVDNALVIQLDLFVAQLAGELLQGVAFGVVGGHGSGDGFDEGELLQQEGELTQGAVETDGAAGHFLCGGEQIGAVLVGGGLQQGIKVALVDGADHLAHVGFGYAARTHGDGLVEQAERVAHGACGGTAEQGEGGGFVGDLFAGQNVRKVLRYLLGSHVAQHELQAAAEHGNGDFVRVGGGEDEFDVLGRLF